MIKELGLTGAKPSWTPLDPNQKLTTIEVDKARGVTYHHILTDMGLYQKLNTRLLCLTQTRLDIGFAVLKTNTFLTKS